MPIDKNSGLSKDVIHFFNRAILYLIEQPNRSVSYEKFLSNVGLDPDDKFNVDILIGFMIKYQMIAVNGDVVSFPYSQIGDIPEWLISLIVEYGSDENSNYSRDDLRKSMGSKPASEKEIITPIMNEFNIRGEWHNIEKSGYPPTDTRIIFHAYDPTNIISENDSEIMYKGDIYLGKWNGTSWDVLIPIIDRCDDQLYDDLDSNLIVSHWDIATASDIHNWENDNKLVNEFLKLKVEIDKDHAEKLRATLKNTVAFLEVVLASYPKMDDTRNKIVESINTMVDLSSVIEEV